MPMNIKGVFVTPISTQHHQRQDCSQHVSKVEVRDCPVSGHVQRCFHLVNSRKPFFILMYSFWHFSNGI